MSSKKLINSPTTCVSDAVEGLLFSNPSLKRVSNLNVIVRKDIAFYKTNHVTLISGGGSGHEPAHAGFIGDGCLSGAVLGNVFASPSVSAILAAIRVCGGSPGVLLIVKNYTGDRLNFGMAMELARQEGLNCKMVIVEDDCALPQGKGITGGRGVAGTVFVHKIAGAAAYNQKSLDEVASIAASVAKQVGSMGLALTTCTVPGTPVSTRLASPEVVEIGMGIHGEPGREQISIPSENAASILAKALVDGILGGNGIASRLEVKQTVAVLINNLGGLPAIEMLIMTKEIMSYLQSRGLKVIRSFVGPFMTSLEMAGISLSILAIDETATLGYLDQPTTASAWIASPDLTSYDSDPIPYEAAQYEKKVFNGPACPVAIAVVEAICRRIVEVEPQLTQYDSICGDGDCGVVMKAGATQILKTLFEEANCASLREKLANDSAMLCDILANNISSAMGGTSGALLELFFRAVAVHLTSDETKSKFRSGEAYWNNALANGVKAMQFYGGASIGMRTMLDALIPGVEALQAGMCVKIFLREV
jgi:triose/dihydroxyacetone kinase / FAD-AMP lyase (cyclizing)